MVFEYLIVYLPLLVDFCGNSKEINPIRVDFADILSPREGFGHAHEGFGHAHEGSGRAHERFVHARGGLRHARERLGMLTKVWDALRKV